MKQFSWWSTVWQTTHWFLFMIGLAGLAAWFTSAPAWWLVAASLALFTSTWYVIYRIVLATSQVPAPSVRPRRERKTHALPPAVVIAADSQRRTESFLRPLTKTEREVVSALVNLECDENKAREAVAAAYRDGAPPVFDPLFREALSLLTRMQTSAVR